MNEYPRTFKAYFTPVMNTCCVPERYKKFNMYHPNPFDPRTVKHQPHAWGSNELILKDKDLRLLARVQPLDLSINKSLANNIWPY